MRWTADYFNRPFTTNRYIARLKPGIVLAFRVAMLLVLYSFIDRGLARIGRLPQHSYEQPVIGVELIEHMGILFLILAAIFIALMHYFRTTIWQRWTAFNHSGPLRAFILLTTGILVWTFAAYDYNLYFNQGHFVDRAVLVGVALLIFWRPVFIFPFLLLLMAISWQFEYPLSAPYLWADYYPLMRILMLFGAVFIWHLLTKRPDIDDFVFMVCCLIAANYWRPGLAKLKIDWFSHGHVYLMILGAYAHGWLAFLDAKTMVSIVQAVAPFDKGIVGITLVLECGALVCLWRRGLFLAFVFGWVLFHLGLFAAFGYLFWKWILIEIGIVVFFLRKKYATKVPIFTIEYFVLSVLLIFASNYWAKSARLAWYDTRLCYTYRLEALGESGRHYDLPPRFFTPYADQFTMNMFGYLAHGSQLVNPYGITGDYVTAKALLESISPDQIQALETQMGLSGFDPKRAGRFDDFLTRYIGHMNRRYENRSWLNVIQPLPFLWSFERGHPFSGNERITRVMVYQNTSLYDEKQYLDIRRKIVREIDIPFR